MFRGSDNCSRERRRKRFFSGRLDFWAGEEMLSHFVLGLAARAEAFIWKVGKPLGVSGSYWKDVEESFDVMASALAAFFSF